MSIAPCTLTLLVSRPDMPFLSSTIPHLVRSLDHLGRAVQTEYVGVGPPVRERRGQVAGTATQIDHMARRRRWDTGQEVPERTPPFVGESQVLLRVPFQSAPLKYLDVEITVQREILDVKRLAVDNLDGETYEGGRYAGRGRPPGVRLGA